ncbi:MAG: transcription termination/antitermination protein NusA [Candidatus Omnitrophica bacterium]|nr:transcription termination/antitermination protein NusA [Candidatus Omnitrophota bacterium]
MNNEILNILDSLERERGISKEILFEAIESALLSAARKILGRDKENISVKVDKETGEIKVTSGRKKVRSEEFGRIAAQTAKQVIIQKIREAEKDIIYEDYTKKVTTITTGLVHRFEKGNIIVDLGKTEAILPRSEQVSKERYKQGDRIRAYIMETNKTSHGPQIVLSRKSPEFIKKLFELEVPEILEGIVEIRAIAREDGERTKVAVYSKDEKIDPVGSCVGMRGSRVKDIVRELHGERIDIVRWSDDTRTYLKNALSPAEISKINIDREHKRIEAILKDDQLSIGIGKHGQNVRLASKLIGWEIDIRGEEPPEKEPKVEKAAAVKKEKEKEKAPSISKIKGVGKKTEPVLIEAGFDSLSKIAAADVKELTKLEGIGKKGAEKIIASAKEMLNNGKR